MNLGFNNFSANEEDEKGVDPAEDKPLGATLEAPTVLETTTKALNVTATPQPDQKPISLSQELLEAPAAPAAISQEVSSKNLNGLSKKLYFF